MHQNNEELIQARHRLEQAQARSRKQERSQRTRRLIQEGAILESVFPQAQHLPLDSLKAELQHRLANEQQGQALP